jgi:outer membrane protein assembly factor BamB
MSDLRDVLERERRRYTLPDGSFDRLERRLRRKRRNDRITAIVWAAILSLVALGAALTALRTVGPELPAAPSITPRTVGALDVLWSATVASDVQGVSAGEGYVVAVTHSDTLHTASVSAFDAACGGADACEPLWTADIGDLGVMPDGPVIRDGMVFVGGEDLFAFPLDCRLDGGACADGWVGRVDPGVADQPVVAEGRVFVGSTDGRVYAFPADCGASAAPCAPEWVSIDLDLPLLPSAVEGDTLFVSVVAAEHTSHLNRIFAFPTHCASPCVPRATWDIHGQAFASMPTVASGILYVGTAVDGGTGSLRAYDASCGVARRCELWREPLPAAANIPRPIVVGDTVIVATRFGARLTRAFPAGSDAPDGPLWSACCTYEISDTTPAVGDGIVFVGSHLEGISAYPTACKPVDGVCQPAWKTWGSAPVGVESGPPARDVQQVAIADGHVYAAVDNTTGDDEVVAFAPRAHRTPGSSGATAAFYGAAAAVLLAAFALRRVRRRLGP